MWTLLLALAWAQDRDEQTLPEDVLDVGRPPTVLSEHGPLRIGAAFGGALSPAGSGPGPFLQVDVAHALPGSAVLDGVVELGTMSTTFQDAIADPRAADARLAYRLTEAVSVAAVGVRLHAPFDPSALRPEATLSVGAAVHRSVVHVVAGDSTNRSGELSVGPVIRLSGGLSGTVSGPLQMVGRIGADALPTSGTLTGRSLLIDLHASIGLRFIP